MTTLRFISLPESIKPSHSAEFAKPVLIVAHGYCMCVFFFFRHLRPSGLLLENTRVFPFGRKEKENNKKKSLLQPEITLLVMKKPDHNSLCTTNISCSISVKVSLFFFFFFLFLYPLFLHLQAGALHAHVQYPCPCTHKLMHQTHSFLHPLNFLATGLTAKPQIQSEI